ncbi:MAG: N-acetylmannosamine-6-phosphate 2-epimerase [Acidobacteria bacterium]|jgi:N-acylglucosamine-6-phosphate 2-epimerase|nr:N-acetylmannosamine-6-phosphate 2-epimerase [Acidobacteriota bacterium]
MTDLKSKIQNLKSKIQNGLIVSCQAPANSPLAKPEIIAALAETAEQNGAVGVRIDSPDHILAVKQVVRVPILGIYKVVSASSKVYITPTFDAAKEIAAAGADVIALDATLRQRPGGESLAEIVRRIKEELHLPVMADVSTLEEGINAVETAGVDFVGTTLSGYTNATKHLVEPDFELIEKLVERLDAPIICEGRLRSPDDVRRAFDCGAFAVVVGGAITGVDQLVQWFISATPMRSANLQAF